MMSKGHITPSTTKASICLSYSFTGSFVVFSPPRYYMQAFAKSDVSANNDLPPIQQEYQETTARSQKPQGSALDDVPRMLKLFYPT